jgi:hypothetical protein
MPGPPADQVVLGHAHVVEVRLDHGHGADAHLVLDLLDREPGVPFSTTMALMRRDLEVASVTQKTV